MIFTPNFQENPKCQTEKLARLYTPSLDARNRNSTTAFHRAAAQQSYDRPASAALHQAWHMDAWHVYTILPQGQRQDGTGSSEW
jgi:hypothetical protein